MKISLTFDNGPDPELTPEVLRILRAHQIRATFFVVGTQLEQHGTRLLAACLEAGHQIGNHSFTHGTPLGLIPGPEGIEEVTRTQSILDRAGAGPRLFRPFGQASIGPHLMSPAVWDHLRGGGYGCVLWNVLGYEWERTDTWVDPAVAACRDSEHSVVVLHDIIPATVAHLDEFLGKLEAAGAEFSQTFPVSCAPLWQGRTQWPEDRLTDVVNAAVP